MASFDLKTFIGCLLILLACTLALLAQNGSVNVAGASLPGAEITRVVPGTFASLSPTQLGVNLLTEPGSSASALSNIIDTRGVKQATLLATCTQGNWTVNVSTYAEDGTVWNNAEQVITAIPAGNVGHFEFGSERVVLANVGTVSAQGWNFPQRAIAFSFTNASVTAGTCTARLFLAY